MKKKILQYEFSDCISKEFKKCQFEIEPVKISEKKEMNIPDPMAYYESSLPGGNFRLAEIVVNQFYTGEGKRKDTPRDDLTLPLLNIYVNAIEFALKLLIRKLFYHYHEQRCQMKEVPEQILSNIENTHNLERLCEIAKQFLPDSHSLHWLPEFNEFSEFVRKIYRYDIDSINTRYLRRKEDLYALHKENHFVDFYKLHANVRKIVRGIIEYCGSDKFSLCSRGEYSEKNFSYLIEARKLMKKKEFTFEQYNRIMSSKDKKDGLYLKLDANEFYSSLQRISSAEKFIEDDIENMSHEDLALLAMGLTYHNRPLQVPPFEHFIHNPVIENKRMIVKYANRYGQALSGINKHIKSIRRFLKFSKN